MEFNRESTSTTKPPLLGGSNNAYKKVRMISFLISIDDEVWDSVEDDYTRPTIVADGQTVPNQKLNG